MRRIFIVDDDEMYQMILRHLIAKLNPDLVIEQYRNGASALEELKRITGSGDPLPDLVFLDINMPIMDGWQFLDGLNEDLPGLHQQLNIYMLSTSLDPRDRIKAQSHSAVQDYICKPISVEILKALIGG